jgi:hypothetical protein
MRRDAWWGTTHNQCHLPARLLYVLGDCIVIFIDGMRVRQSVGMAMNDDVVAMLGRAVMEHKAQIVMTESVAASEVATNIPLQNKRQRGHHHQHGGKPPMS